MTDDLPPGSPRLIGGGDPLPWAIGVAVFGFALLAFAIVCG